MMFPRGRSNVQIEDPRDRHYGCQRGVRPLGGEEAPNSLWLHADATREVGFRQLQLLAPRIESADYRVDLLDPLQGLIVGLPVFGIVETVLKIALCTCSRGWHAVRIAVTFASRTIPLVPALGFPGRMQRIGDNEGRSCH